MPAMDGKGGGDPVLAGSRFRFTPRLNTNVTARWDQPISPSPNLIGRVRYRYRSTQFVDTAGMSRQGSVHLVDVDIGVRLPSCALSVALSVKNLFDNIYVEHALTTPLQAGSVSGFPGLARTVELMIARRF